MPSEPVWFVDWVADQLDHDEALHLVRRLKRRFPCMSHERCFCPSWQQEVFDDQ